MPKQWHIQLWLWSFCDDDDDDYMMIETKMDKTGLPLRNISEAGTSFPLIFLLTSLQVQTLRDRFHLTIDLLNTLVHCTFGMAMSMTIRHWFCVSFCCMICQNHNIYQPFFSSMDLRKVNTNFVKLIATKIEGIAKFQSGVQETYSGFKYIVYTIYTVSLKKYVFSRHCSLFNV